MANEPLKGVAPQVQARPAVPTPAQQPAPAPAATEQVAPIAEPTAPSVEPMKDRTQENFDKLLKSNDQLYQANQANSLLIQQLLQKQTPAPQAPAAPVATPPTVDPNDFIEKDPTTGEQYINEQKLRSTLSQVQERATRAEQLAQNFIQAAEQRERQRQDQEAFAAYPELDNRSEKYDGEFNKFTRALLTDSMLNQRDYGGRSLSFKEAADLIRQGVRPTQAAVSQVTQQIVTEPQPVSTPTANQINKEQAAASVVNQPPQAQAEISAEALRDQQLRTRRGDDQALAERLMHTEHIFGPESGSGEQPV